MMRILWLFLLISVQICSAQSYDQFYPKIKKNGRFLSNVGGGSLISPQFSQIDLNNDGYLDLFVFDRADNQISTYIFEGNSTDFQYVYDDKYITDFPQMQNFSKLLDYNEDGLLDVFTWSSNNIPGIEVWKNVGTKAKAEFEKVLFSNYTYDVLNYPSSTTRNSNIYVSNLDIPAIYDLDGDGDLDILTFDGAGKNLIFYQNKSKEKNLSPDAFAYELQDACYGLFYENEFTEEIVLSTSGDCSAPFKEDAPRHTGSTTLVFDLDGDGSTDLLLGDIGSENIVYLHNKGTSVNAWMDSQIKAFPTDNPVEIQSFNAAFEIDVDNDGKKDLLIAPNDGLGSDNIDNVWYYHNDSKSNVADYRLVTKSFLKEESLNLGKYTYPIFLDYNADGLMDILVGSSGYTSDTDKGGRLFLLQNIGTESSAEYELIDEDYLDMKSLDIFRLAPAVGDIDKDGDMDLLVGSARGEFYYFENIAGANQPFQFKTYEYPYKNIKPGFNPKPQLFDLDGDGWVDIITGEKNDNPSSDNTYYGGVNFYKNNDGDFDSDVTSTGNTPVLGGVYTRDIGLTSTGASAPFFVMTNDGLRCIVGSASGKFRLYDDIEGNIYGKFNKLEDELPIRNLGNKSTSSLANIDDDKYYEMVIGTARGGLFFYNTNLGYDKEPTDGGGTGDKSVNLFPNPVQSTLNITTDDFVSAEIFNIQGQLILKTLEKSIDMKDFPNGIYIVKVILKEGRAVSKILKI